MSDFHTFRKKEELLQTVTDLQKRVLGRARVKKTVAELEDLLALKELELKETRDALFDLMEHGSDLIADLERKMFSNLQNMVFPYLEKLARRQKDAEGQLLVEVIRANLEKISSSFSQKLVSRIRGITPREIEVAEFIKLGKSTKEISNLLDLSPRTVETYRDSLRVKLNIKNKKINLRSYLASIS